ncbi:MAG: hypothetical protein KAQ90_09830 [Melioribacteraceae bacterium]|nr:hypothetical protein [Melioribacteraceae bacterium]
MYKLIRSSLLLLIGILLISGCSASPDTADRTVSEKKIIRTWTENDSKFVSDSLVSDLFNGDWIIGFSKKRKPVFVVGKIENKSSEKIDTEQFAKDVERNLLDSGEITFVASKEKREIIRDERKDRDDFESDKEFKKYLKSLKADIYLSGNINLTIDTLALPPSKSYKAEINILDIKKYKVVWNEKMEVVK